MLAKNLIWYPLHLMKFQAAIKNGEKPDAKQSEQQGHDDAATLANADDLLLWLATESEGRRKIVAALHKNPGTPETVAFAKTMVESWIFLTGKKPSSKSTHFKNFVAKAWEDISPREYNWEHPIRKATEALTEYQVAQLALNGPDWK